MASESDNDKNRVKGFKRINFFRGFLTTETDWNDAERYHIDKRRLHNKMLHAPGVVFGYAGDLRVLARTRNDLSIEIQPGYAIDGEGRDLMLWDAEIKTLSPEDYKKLPQILYVVLRYYEQETDFIAYKENASYKGNRRILEGCKIEISQTAPDIRQEVELGRILLDKNATRLRDAQDPTAPKANEIDLRYVPRAGVAGSSLDPALRLRITQMLDRSRRVLLSMARDSQVGTAHDALAGVVAAQALHSADLLDGRNALDVMAMLAQLEDEVIRDVQINHPQLLERKEFGGFRRQVESMKESLAQQRRGVETLARLLEAQQKAADELQPLFSAPGPNEGAPTPGRPIPVTTEPKADLKPQPSKPGDENVIPPDDMERIKGISTLDLPRELTINGETWTQIDSININDPESENSHGLKIEGAKDTYRSKQRLKYPDETLLEDVGRAHVGGYVTYKAKGVTPGRRLLVVRRMDYVYGDYTLEFEVDGKKAGTCECPGTDRVHRWRNWPYILPAAVIEKAEVLIKQMAVTAERDINMFRFWFYQSQK